MANRQSGALLGIEIQGGHCAGRPSRADMYMRGGLSPVTVTQATPAVNVECPECKRLLAPNTTCVHCATTRQPVIVAQHPDDSTETVRRIVKGGQLEVPRLKYLFAD